MDTGIIIKLLRTADGISQTELAKKLGVSRAYLSQVENNKKQPGMPFLREVSRVFQIPLALLVIENDKEHSEIYGEFQKLLGNLLSVRLALRKEQA